MTMPRNPRSHFLLPDHITKTELFQGEGRGSKKDIPPQQREAHSAHLRANLAALKTISEEANEEQKNAGWSNGLGLSIKFTSFPDVEFALEGLDLISHGIELLSVRSVAHLMFASVWLPYGKLGVFEDKIKAYLEYKCDINGKPRDNQKFLDAIQDVRASVIEDIWTDDALLPRQDQPMRFEAWLSKPIDEAKNTSAISNRKAKPHFLDSANRIQRFRNAAEAAGMWVGSAVLNFPERDVLLVRGTLAQLQSSSYLLGHLAELRRAPETADFFMQLPRQGQQPWIAELLQRTTFIPKSEVTPHVCVLDTGCLQGHPLLSQTLDQADLHTVNAAWDVTDHIGHGTGQAGLAIWGDLVHAFESTSVIHIGHRTESVKVFLNQDENDVEHYGALTRDAVSMPELAAPYRRRLFSMAVTSTATTRRGTASAWSAEIDALTSDYAGDGSLMRLMLISAGNVHNKFPSDYPSRNSLTSVEDPAQAWNALTVGAITHKTLITEAITGSYKLIAENGALSPYSSTSKTWDSSAPFKPEVVFEGGNMGEDSTIVSGFDSLDVLTAHHDLATRLIATSHGTSAATALASRFCARLMAHYPAYWPETIRALTVHSAEWTPALCRQYPGTSKSDFENRLRHCGWGEPDLDRALHSGADSLTLIVQGVLQPFQKKPKLRIKGKATGGNITACDMHLHQLPWPTESLRQLFYESVELRITLSYFVEPNPGQRGRSNRFSYQSFGLRFAAQKKLESLNDFRKRINKLAIDADNDEQNDLLGSISDADSDWLLGPKKRFRGSLHHDRLTCSGADLAARANIAVFPVGGWWKNREALNRFDRKARYSLVVSIKTPETAIEVDLCTEVEQLLAVPVAVEVESLD